MRKDISVNSWSDKVRNALKLKAKVICVFQDPETSKFLVCDLPNMDDTTKHCVENLENQMDKVIRISNSLNKKIASAASNANEKHDQSDQDGNGKKNKDTRDLKIKCIVSQNEDLRHIAQTLTLELERSRNIEKNLRAENCKLLQEKENYSLEVSSLQAKELILESSLQDAKENLEKLQTENSALKLNGNNSQNPMDRDFAFKLSSETRDKCEEMKDEINALRDSAESRALEMQNQIDNLKTTLYNKEIEFREKMQKKEREIEEKFATQLDTLRNENRKLLHEKEILVLQETSLQTEGRILGRDLQEAKASLEKAKEENEFLKHEFNSPIQRADQLIGLKIEEQEIAKRFEEVKASYDERIRVMQQDFESRRLVMVSEVQRLRTALNDKDTELRTKFEANERQMKEKYKSEIELISKQYRTLLEEKGKLTFEMCNLQSQERAFEHNEEKCEELKTQNEYLKNELAVCRQKFEQNISSKHEVQELIIKLQEMKSSYENLIRNLQRDFESRDLVTKREIEMLRNTLSEKDFELQGKLQRKEKDIQQRYSKRIETLSDENIALLREKENYRQEIEVLHNQEAELIRNLQEAERNLEKFQIENESLKRDLGAKKRYMEEIIRLNNEKQDKVKELEETRSSYDGRISSILGDFEARRLVMVNEIEKLRAVIEEKEGELRQKAEKERQEKERVGKYIESLNIELRKQLQEKEKIISDMGTLRSQEKILSQKLKDAELNIEKQNAEREAMKRELIVVRQQTQQMANLKYEEEEARKRFDKTRASYEDRIHALQQDFEMRRLVMVNEMEKLRKALEIKNEETAEKVDEKEREVKENYEKLVECLSNELKRRVAEAKQNEDLIHEKWNAKLVDCREQMRRNMLCLEKQIEISTNNATMRNNQLSTERDELKSQMLILEKEIERKRRQYEVDLIEKEKKLEGVAQEYQRMLQEIENLKENLAHKDNMIDVLQDTVRKECTEREDILRKLDEIRKSSKSPKPEFQLLGTTSEDSAKEKACLQYVPPTSSKQLVLSPEVYGVPAKRLVPAYMKGIPLMLPPSCLPPSKGGTPIRFPSTPKLNSASKDGAECKLPDMSKLCVVGHAPPEIEFTVGKGKTKKSGKLIRSRSLQTPTPTPNDVAHHYEREHAVHG